MRSLVLAGALTLVTAAPVAADELGTATYYCGAGSRCTIGYQPGDLVAAIDRKDSSYRPGDRVRVCRAGECVVVRIVDVCGCPGRRIIDLSAAAFRRLGPLSAGVIRVTLSDPGPAPTLPPTETDTRWPNGITGGDVVTIPDPDAGWRTTLALVIGWRVLALVLVYLRGR